MSDRQQEFLRKLRATFLAEAREHLQAMSAGLFSLEQATTPDALAEWIETVFRHTHSLKGAARATGFDAIEAICHAAEELFSRIRQQRLVPTRPMFDALHRAFAQLEALVAAGEQGTTESRGDEAVLQELKAQLGAGATGHAIHSAAPPPPSVPATDRASQDIPAFGAAPVPSADSLRVSAENMDRMLVAIEELLGLRGAASALAAELGALEAEPGQWLQRWAALQGAVHALRVEGRSGGGEALRPAVAVLDFLDWSFGFMKALEARCSVAARAAGRHQQAVTKQVDELLAESKDLLLVPFGALGNLLQRAARDLGAQQGKELDLPLAGGDVLLDKRVLDRLRDPLLHLVRNAVDHGIETPQQRRAAGKPVRGRVDIGACVLAGGRVEIVIADDGAGIDPDRVRAAALRRGIVDEDALAGMDDAAALELVFRSDVSTSPLISAISGRGLGLAIVRDQVRALGGRLELDNLRPRGTRLRIVVPQRMVAFRGVLTRVADQQFVLPTMQVERVARVPRSAVRTVQNRETVELGGEAVALARLQDVLEMPARRTADEVMTVVVLGASAERIAFVVDEVLHEEDVLVRQLRRPLQRVRNVAGATVLASGRIAPVLHVTDLLASARLAGTPLQAEAAAAPVDASPLRILLAEDSITSRMLLKGILEAEGYVVVTATDGVEAYTALRSEPFDVLVSDVEMPRMDGFALTARVRSDQALANLPVVLVTALATREHRERGIDVGANAYITKGSFDQGELLDVVRRLAAHRERR